jgi:hypothetical protein
LKTKVEIFHQQKTKKFRIEIKKNKILSSIFCHIKINQKTNQTTYKNNKNNKTKMLKYLFLLSFVPFLSAQISQLNIGTTLNGKDVVNNGIVDNNWKVNKKIIVLCCIINFFIII